MDTDKLITNTHGLEVYDGVRPNETDEQALDRARRFYQTSIDRYEEIISKQGNGKDNYWLNCLNTEKAKIASVQIETEKDYFARVRKVYLDPPAKEITEERYEEMLDVLPPCAYTHNGRYSMFYVSEALHFSYHGFYLHDKKTGKYWTKVCDACDRSTWIDVALGLRAA